jgi:hypothetical protein
MVEVDNISLYLPQYLSEATTKALIQNLKQFPDNIDKRFYSILGTDREVLYQGDGIASIKVCDLKAERFLSVPCMLISNTCDMDLANKRDLKLNLVYAPIFNLEKLEQKLGDEIGKKEAFIKIKSIKNQHYSSYFYLPKCTSNLSYDGFVSMDKMFNMSNDEDLYKELIDSRLFRLSQYGFYIFLFKLSYHFTRMKEAVDRDK